MNKMKKFLATFIAMGTLLTMAGCGTDKSTDSMVSTSKNESVADKETTEQTELVTEEVKTPVGKLEDCPKITIELKDGTFTYNGESFEDVYQQLTDLGIAKEKSEGYYAESGYFNSDWIEASNGTKFSISYSSENKFLTIATGEGVKNKVAWDIEIGDIDNTMTIADLVDMGATEIKEKHPHSEIYNVKDYLLTSENFETKGVSIKASGDGSPQLEDLVVEGIEIKYSGVEN